MSRRGVVTPKILEVLECDGGWLTSEGIALCVHPTPPADTVRHALLQLRKTGVVEARRRPINETPNNDPLEYRLP